MTQPPTRPTSSGQAAETPDSNEEDEESSPITRTAVLACALEIIDRDGVDGLSMRRLGEAVGRDPTVLYRHVSSKAAVLDGVVELIFTELNGMPTSVSLFVWLPEYRGKWLEREAERGRRIRAHVRAVIHGDCAAALDAGLKIWGWPSYDPDPPAFEREGWWATLTAFTAHLTNTS